jgi:hypothetical protein
MVGIVPNDLGKTLAHGSIATQILGWSNACWAPIYRLFGCPLAPINIPEQYLLLSASEVKEQIDLRRAHTLGRNSAEPYTPQLADKPNPKFPD